MQTRPDDQGSFLTSHMQASKGEGQDISFGHQIFWISGEFRKNVSGERLDSTSGSFATNSSSSRQVGSGGREVEGGGGRRLNRA